MNKYAITGCGKMGYPHSMPIALTPGKGEILLFNRLFPESCRDGTSGIRVGVNHVREDLKIGGIHCK
jgi:hypothetical protein